MQATLLFIEAAAKQEKEGRKKALHVDEGQ